MKKIENMKEVIHNLCAVLKLIFCLKKRYLIIVTAISLISTITPFATLILSQQLLNGLQQNNSNWNYLIFILSVYIFIQFISACVNVLQGFCFGKFSEYVRCELSKYYDRLCAKLTVQDFENDTIYDMIQRAEYGFGSRPVIIFNNFMGLFNGLISIIFSAVVLVQWNVWILLGFIILPLVCFNYFKKVSDYDYRIQYERVPMQRKSWYFTYLLTKDYYIKEVRILGLTDFLLKSKHDITDVLYNQNVDLLKKKSILKAGYNCVNFVFLFIIVFIALVETFNGKIMIGNFMTYVNTSTKVGNHITSIFDSLFALYSDSLYCENVIEFIDYVQKNHSEEHVEEKIVIDEIKEILIKKLYFKYPKSNSYALKNINFEIRKNDIVVFIGENGSGKTTLIKILLGIYDDYEGEILINGIELKKIDKKTYLKQISTIFQDYNCYEFKVKNNIEFGDIAKIHCKDDLENVSKLVLAHNFIHRLPNKYEQQVGNWFKGGIQLSGGEWQKLALARGLLKNSELYIFDEPTSSLDPTSEYNFFTNVISVFKNKIGIFVTHRFINARIANKIIVLREGEIIEYGTHEILMKQKKYYYKMYVLQQGFINEEK